jgi:hypothetical protein
MVGLPKLLLIVLVVFAVWYAMRAFNRMRPPVPPPRERQRSQTRPLIEAEDLVSCRVCGTYIATSARHCGRAGCPQPR